MIEIVFFDAGETILHPHPSFPELFASVCTGRGLRVSPDDVMRVQERLAPHLVDLAEDSGVANPSLSAADARTFWTYLYRRFLEELGIPDEGLAAALLATFSDASSYMLFDDVMPTLRSLQDDGYRLGLISNFEGWLEERLVELEVGHVFDVSVISGLEGVEKPDPEIYRRALERAQVMPTAAVHVGDSPAFDIEPAATLGMHTVLLDRVGRYAEASGLRISSLKELPALVANI
jgi:putative hydrolase of the HAD superfamily